MSIEHSGLSTGEKQLVGNYLRGVYASRELGGEDKEKIIEDSLLFMDTLTKDVQLQVIEATVPPFLHPIDRSIL